MDVIVLEPLEKLVKDPDAIPEDPEGLFDNKRSGKVIAHDRWNCKPLAEGYFSLDLQTFAINPTPIPMKKLKKRGTVVYVTVWVEGFGCKEWIPIDSVLNFNLKTDMQLTLHLYPIN